MAARLLLCPPCRERASERAARRGMGGVFVTVGTTSFDALVATVDSAPFAALLHERGFTELTVQYGKRTHNSSSDAAAMWQ